MKNTFIFLALISSLTFISCGQKDPNNNVDEGNIEGEIYENKEIGWTIRIPSDWKIIAKNKLESSNEKSKVTIEKSSGQEIDVKSLKYLINFQKDQFNLFASTSEPFVEEFPGDFELNNKRVNEMLYKTFVDNGIRVDTSSGKETIQGLEFNTFNTTLYTAKGVTIMNSVLYSKLINGFCFGVTICYNNLSDKKTLLRAWKNSKFK